LSGKVTPDGVTFPDNSTQTKAVSGGGVSAPLHLNGSFVDFYPTSTDAAVISGVNTHSNIGFSYGGYFEAAGSHGTGVTGVATGSEGTGVRGYGYNTGNVTNYGGYFRAAGSLGRGVYGHASNDGFAANYGGYFEAAGSSGRGVYGVANGYWGIGVSGRSRGTDSEGIGVYGNGTKYDFYAAGGKTNFGPFTGAHEVKFVRELRGGILPGMIVSTTGKTEVRKDENGSISLSSTLPTVALSTKAKDKAVFGVIVSEGPLPKDHWYEPREGEHFGVVNALGEGRVWVTNRNGNIENGDYITTSEIPGYGQMQNDDFLHSYTLGKAIETVDWEQISETVEYAGETYKRYLIAIVYTSG